MPTTITLSGFKEFEKKCQDLPGILLDELDGEVEDASRTWATLAKQDAPTDQGFLKGQISNKKVGIANWEVVSGANYSSFIEWGTRSKRRVPSDLQAYEAALQYTKSGDYYDFLNAILDWVKRKGLSNVTNSYTGKKVGGKAAKENLVVLAEAIAWSILKKGINPHPYFFIQVPLVEKQFLTNAQKVLNTEH